MALVSVHPQFSTIFQTIQQERNELFGAWEGKVFRSALPRWQSPPYRFTGVGSLLAGGRWNVKHLIPAVYFSADSETAAAEADAKAVRFGWPLDALKPQTRLVVHLSLSAVLDLTRVETLGALKLEIAKLTSVSWEEDQLNGEEAITQAVGRAAFENLAEGLVVPSARRAGGVNIVVFPSNLRPGSKLETEHEAEIPLLHGLG